MVGHDFYKPYAGTLDFDNMQLFLVVLEDRSGQWGRRQQ
jgi:hypothetical protein